MTPSALLASLREAGFTLHLDAGRVMVAPASKLTPDQRGAIARNRDALAALLDHPSEDAVQAMCERAYFDPPDWGKGTAQVRESVILRMEGFPTVAMSVEAFEGIRVHNELASVRPGVSP